MPPPQKGHKILVYHDTQFRWIMQNRSGFNELVIEMAAAVNGQKLVATLPRIVNHSMITSAIDFGRKNGWTPDKEAPAFQCKYLRGSFHMPPAATD
ncbi:hypothetical protein JIN85_12900 [Luteolibacter pohnpeiensis]|uniref:Uncharacterized protein n=1 Tax=Luteolibacter pohnpeiensis TaxID=454153 RepID=A0A934S7L6_9BACT|nr:hypothetical protein [Luteolibacter pohnpeiensis]MBK1883318.1 hypothetical protein [Luteolibacter pohnpeiensis]